MPAKAGIQVGTAGILCLAPGSGLQSAGAGPRRNDESEKNVLIVKDSEMEQTVVLRNVSKVYRQNSLAVHALTDINLDIPKKDFACLSGPSGSGKSTLLNLIGGLDKPTTGEISADGSPADQLGRRELGP